MREEMDSDSDDNLEDISSFLPKKPKGADASVSAINHNEGLESPHAISSKLDALLSEHRKETRLQEMKAELLNNLSSEFSQKNIEKVEDALPPEYARVIDNLDVETTELPVEHPTSQVFHKENFCCLFGDDVHPSQWGFSPSSSKIDKLLSDLTPDTLTNFLLSEILSKCCYNVSNMQPILVWLFSIISIHSSDLTVEASSQNMKSLLLKLKLFKVANDPVRNWWCPTPLQLLTIFVNMGANPADLIVSQTLYTDEIVRTYLAAFDRKSNERHSVKSCGCVQLTNCTHLFEILARSLQTRPDFSKEELNAILIMIMKVSLDETFKHLHLQRLFQVCISSLLECYTEADWPAVVPDLCHQINGISDHHHSAVYLTELLPIGDRGQYLQIRLNFLLLCTILRTDVEKMNLNLHLPNISLLSITNLGHHHEETGLSELAKALKHLIEKDVYKMRSALHHLDRAVGDEINRCKQPQEDLDYLISQIKEVTRGIRDNIFGLDLSRIKDIMSYMTFKWTMVLARKSRMVQRSIFPWVTASQALMKEEVLEDSQGQSSEEEIEEDNK